MADQLINNRQASQSGQGLVRRADPDPPPAMLCLRPGASYAAHLAGALQSGMTQCLENTDSSALTGHLLVLHTTEQPPHTR